MSGSTTTQTLELYSDLNLIRSKRPLIEVIVNRVALNDAVNVTLSLGGSPVAAQMLEDLEDIVAASSAVYLNGGVDEGEYEAISEAARLAEKHGVPVVLDPVAAGASKFRTRFWLELIESHRVSVVKGNAGEISALLGSRGVVKGVDSLVDATRGVAVEFSERFGVVAAVTGKTDYVAQGGKWAAIDGGSELFKYVTGTGCMAGAAITTFLGVERNPFRASVGGLATFKAAGSLAAKKSAGPGSFRTNLFDALYNFRKEDYANVSITFGEA